MCGYFLPLAFSLIDLDFICLKKKTKEIPTEKEQQFHKTFQTGISITDPHWRFSFYCWWYTLLMRAAAAGQTLRNYIMHASLVHQSSPTSSNPSIYQKCCPMRLLTNKWRDDVLIFVFFSFFFFFLEGDFFLIKRIGRRFPLLNLRYRQKKNSDIETSMRR